MQMQPITLPFRYIAELQTGEFNVTESMDVIRAMRDRGARIVSSALAYEEVIVQILARSLFREIRENRLLVEGLVLQSDWCSFAAKRKLLQATLVNLKLTTPAVASELDQALAHIMRYRNAFAHGMIVAEGIVHVLKYFESSPKRAVLDDSYWQKLELRFNSPWEKLLKIETQLEKSDA